MLPLPELETGRKYKSCCGKIICSGCIHAVAKRDGGVGLCPFCRSPNRFESDEEIVEQMKKRIKAGDAEAMYGLGNDYSEGYYGLPQDYAKALELWHQAAELGHAKAYYSIGMAYYRGDGVEIDERKIRYYWTLAAIGGDVESRHNLGAIEINAGNAVKHFMIAAGVGYKASLSAIQEMFKNGEATKDDYAKALRAYQSNLIEIKSAQRDEAAAANDCYKYY